MTTPFVMTLLAKNRVGLLTAISNGLSELGGNLREVSQTVIQDYFTMIMAVDFPENRTADLIVEHLGSLCKAFDAQICIEDPSKSSPGWKSKDAEPTEPYCLTVLGKDRPGSLRTLILRLASEGIMVTDLHATTETGTDHFTGRFLLAIPVAVDRIRLQRELADLGENEGLGIILQHARVVAATQNPSALETMTPVNSRS